MHMTSVLITLNVLLLTKQTIQTSENSDVERLSVDSGQGDENPILLDENGKARDKRALGVLLQGLVQALGYNPTPVQLASLPNPNTIGTMVAGPVSVDLRPGVLPAAAMPSSRPPSGAVPQAQQPPRPPGMLPPLQQPPRPPGIPPSPPRQRETLKFTGVFNFGNNSDILGHLRRYEQLFHGAAPARPGTPQQSQAAAPPNQTQNQSPAINPRNAPTRQPLLEPFLVPIPIPLSPNIQSLQDLQYPPPRILSIGTPSVEKPLQYGAPPIMKEEYTSKEDGSANREDQDKDNQTSPGLYENNDDDDDNDQKKGTDDEDSNDAEDNLSGGGEKETYVAKGSENSEEQRESEEGTGKDHSEKKQASFKKAPASTSKENGVKKESVEDPETWIFPYKIPNYQSSLPIENKPIVGPFTNSYGQSLEKGGQIDANVADYLKGYKNTQSGLFDEQSISGGQEEKPWWNDGNPGTPLQRLNAKFKKDGRTKFKEHNLDRPSNIHIAVNQETDDTEESVEESEEESSVRDQKAQKYNDSESEAESTEPETEDKQPLSFDFIKYSPYFKPVQYFFPPESLQKSTQSILSNQELQDYRRPKPEDVEDIRAEYPSVTAKSIFENVPNWQVNQGKIVKRPPTLGFTFGTPQANQGSQQPKFPIAGPSAGSQDFEDSEVYDDQPNREQPVGPDYESSETTEEPATSNNSPGRLEEDDSEAEAEPIKASQYYESNQSDAESRESSETLGQDYQSPEAPATGYGQNEEARYAEEEAERKEESEHVPRISSTRNQKPLKLPKNYRSGAKMREPLLDPRDTSEVRSLRKVVQAPNGRDVQITTFNPITYRFPPKNLNDDLQTTTPRGQSIRYGFPNIEDGQYLPYSESPSIFHTHLHDAQKIAPLDDFIFGRKIDPSSEVHSGASAEKHYSSRNENSGIPKKILGPKRNLGKTSALPSEFNSANSQRSKNSVSGRSGESKLLNPI